MGHTNNTDLQALRSSFSEEDLTIINSNDPQAVLNLLNQKNLKPSVLKTLINLPPKSQSSPEEKYNDINVIVRHVRDRLSALLTRAAPTVDNLIKLINTPDYPLPDNLQTVLMSEDFLGLRNVLKTLISLQNTQSAHISSGSKQLSKNLLDIFENLEKKHSPTHIATRIKELILGQGISAEDFSSLVWEELQRHRESPLPEQSYQTLLQAVNQEFESIDQKFQSTQPQEGLRIERKLKNLLEKTEFLDLVEILTHLPLDTPKDYNAKLTLALVENFVLSSDYKAKNNQPPIITAPAPTPTPAAVSLLPFLQRRHEQQTA